MKTNYNIVYNKCNSSAIDVLNINGKNWKIIIKNQNLEFKINLKNTNRKIIKKIIKNIEKITTKIRKKGKTNKKITFYIINYNQNNQNHSNFIKAIEVVFIEKVEDRYNYIYDEVCSFLDNEFTNKKLCEFKDNKCGEKLKTSSEVGCCRHYKNKILGPLNLNGKLVICEYLKDKKCSAKCISCKLYTCDYLKNKGIQFKIKNILLLDIFFNPIQKYIIKYSVFTPKEIIIKKLLKKSIKS